MLLEMRGLAGGHWQSIETTIGFYVDLDADELAEDLYRTEEARESMQGRQEKLRA